MNINISEQDLKKLLLSYIRLLYSKPVLTSDDREVIEIINRLIGE